MNPDYPPVHQLEFAVLFGIVLAMAATLLVLS
jgi:hypothetical protein